MKNNNTLGVSWILLHGLVLTLMFALGKLLNEKVDIMQMLFIYHFLAFSILLIFLLFAGIHKIKTNKIHIHFLRAFLNIAGYMAYFYGLQFMTLDGATSITYLLPIVVSYLATIFFREHLTKARITALIAGFIGIIIILKPGTEDFQISAVWILISVVVWSACDLITKKLGKTETVFNQAFYTTFFGTIISAPLGIYYWVEEIVIDDLFILAVIAILLILQIISIFKSFQHADFSIVMPFDYFRLPLSTLIGYIMFGEIMALNTIIGSIIIIAGGLYLIRHEHKKQYITMPIS